MAMVGGGVDERITRRATQAGLVLEREIVCELAQYLELLFRWNRRMNLTALTDDDNGVDRLVIEPLAAAQLLPEGCTAIIDIGSDRGWFLSACMQLGYNNLFALDFDINKSLNLFGIFSARYLPIPWPAPVITINSRLCIINIQY